MFSDILRDLRVATRVLLKSPGFTAVSVVTLGLAIGANAAIFSVLNGVVLRPLPYQDAAQLVTYSLDATPAGAPELPLSPAGYWHFLEKNRTFENMGGFVPQVQPLVGDGEPEQVDISMSTWTMFTTLGTSPQMGRTFTEEEDLPGGASVAVISHELWTSRFGEDPDIVGKTLDLNGVVRDIIGVMPPGFNFPAPETKIWVPLQIDPATQNFGGHGIAPVARLSDGMTLEAGHADLVELISRLDEVGYGPAWFNGVFTGEADIQGLREEIIGDSRRSLFIIFGAVAAVFLIACSNVANLFMVRTRSRTRETAVRSAMGATRTELTRYTLSESFVLAVASGALGLFLAFVGTRVLLAVQPAAIPRIDEIGLDGRVLLFSLGVTIAASVLLGLLPALKAGKVQVAPALRDGGRSGTAGKESQAFRGTLVVAQVAMAVMLLVGSGLLVRSAQALRAVDPGFESSQILTFGVSLAPASYPSAELMANFFIDLIDSIEEMPGVEAAGGIDVIPLAAQGSYLATIVEGQPLAEDEFPPAFHVRRVTPGFFDAVGISLNDGRLFTNTDHQQRLGTVIVGERVANELWPGESALGHRLQPSTAGFSEIVGVVEDVRVAALDQPADAVIYLPMHDSIGGGTNSMTIAVRTAADPLSVVPAIRAEVNRRDSNVPITDVRTMSGLVGASIADETFTTFVLTIAAVIALILGSVGIYGLISYIVGQRTAEIGIRMSLGADSPSIRSLFLRQGWTLTGIGILVGIGAAILATRLLGTLVFGVSAYDPLTFIAAPVVFFLIATLACLIPASRAASVDPAIAFRAK